MLFAWSAYTTQRLAFAAKKCGVCDLGQQVKGEIGRV